MKQYVSFAKEIHLTMEARNRLIDWMAYHNTSSRDVFTIGEMIEFLEGYTESALEALAIDKGEHEWHVYWLAKDKPAVRAVELADALWSLVKEKLERS